MEENTLMVTINGTLQDHIALNNWAMHHNEKLVEFIKPINHETFETDVYPVITMPDNVSKWMVFNCHLDFIKEFYLNKYGLDEIPYGAEIE